MTMLTCEPVWDHPRMCGEHVHHPCASWLLPGSSPHVRGARAQTKALDEMDGIIPACAGSTSAVLSIGVVDRDHPRMCGEHVLLVLLSPFVLGSSPHVRGARMAYTTFCTEHGIIPACAGSTGTLVTPHCESWDHPRMCGEHSGWTAATGSACGIIPACAGSTSRCSACRRGAGDHPRMCGEHDRHAAERVDEPGSSPHVRGAPSDIPAISVMAGIIPACAGSTSTTTCSRTADRDHPRMCGEHYGVPVRFARFGGSSPHVRGAHYQHRRHGRIDGIIPACAGSTKFLLIHSRRSWDHPRMCGEHTMDSSHCNPR